MRAYVTLHVRHYPRHKYFYYSKMAEKSADRSKFVAAELTERQEVFMMNQHEEETTNGECTNPWVGCCNLE